MKIVPRDPTEIPDHSRFISVKRPYPQGQGGVILACHAGGDAGTPGFSAESKINFFLLILLGSIFAFSFEPEPAAAQAVTLTLGKQHFVDGQKPVGPGTFDTVAAGEPAPFNAFIGSNPTGPNFSATWAYTYTAPSTISGATLTLGIVDGDSQAPQDTVASFTLDSIDLAGPLNTVFDFFRPRDRHSDLFPVTTRSGIRNSGTNPVSWSWARFLYLGPESCSRASHSAIIYHRGLRIRSLVASAAD